MSFTVRTMKKDEVSIALKWAEIEGWNPGINDADCFHAADPNGFLVGENDGEPIGSVSVVKYGDDFGFLGLYIVRPEFRGKGYGIRIWNAGIEYLSGRNIGLDGVVAQQGNYMKWGLSLAYRNVRYEGKDIGKGNALGADIVELSSVPFNALAEYDRRFFPAPRKKFLECWISRPETISLGILGDNKKLAGYSVMRPCHIGFKIGPLFADNPALAEKLFLSLCQTVPCEPVFLDVPEPNTGAVALVERYGMKRVFETARMYTKGEPALTLENIFGVTTFELG